MTLCYTHIKKILIKEVNLFSNILVTIKSNNSINRKEKIAKNNNTYNFIFYYYKS